MSNIQRRLEKIEKLLDIDRTKPIVKIIEHMPHKAGFAPDIPEPLEDWVTYKKANEEVEKSNSGFLFFTVDPYREYEVRNNLPEGIISKDELRGKIPFSELLARATKSDQKQLKAENL